MKTIVTCLVLLVAVILLSGCTENAHENSANQQSLRNNSTSSQNLANASVVEAANLKQINMYLQKNPVYLAIGSEGCSDCQDMKPILTKVASEYGNRVTVMSADMVKSPQLAKYFGAYVVPVSFMIIGIKNGNYTYMLEDGTVSSDELKSRVIGPRDKASIEKILDDALSERKKLK